MRTMGFTKTRSGKNSGGFGGLFKTNREKNSKKYQLITGHLPCTQKAGPKHYQLQNLQKKLKQAC